MVQKFGKFGVRSGNSLKGSNSRYLRRYRRDAVVFRETINCPNLVTSSANILGQTDVQSNDVPYSLNKKGRWSLPEEIKRSILTGEFRHEEFGVQLVELHKINKAANCTAVYASRGPLGKLAIQKRKSKKHRRRSGYMQAKSIINAKPHGASKRRRREVQRRGLTIDEENVDSSEEPSQIRYEVIYPSPVTSSVTHNPKYIGFETTKGRNKIGHKKRRRKHRLALMYEDVFDMEEQFDDSVDEDCYYGNEQSSKSERHESFLINDLIKRAKLVQQRFTRQENKRRKSSGDETQQDQHKNKLVYEYESSQQNDDSVDVSESQTLMLRHTLTSEPVLVCLKVEDVDPGMLHEAYGATYIESECFPRKFIIDISEMANQTNMFQNCWKHCPDKINACIVFVFDVDNEMNTLKEQVCKVYLNTPVHDDISSMKIETLFDYMETTVKECLTRSLFFMETLSDYLDVPMTSTVYGRKISTSTEELQKVAKWETLSYIPNTNFVYNAFIKTRANKVNKAHQITPHDSMNPYTTDGGNNVSSPRSRFCGICYETLGLPIPGTALVSCGHWFCNACWTEYLETQVGNGAISLVCPEFECDTAVDPGTTMSILNIRDIIKFARHCHDTKVEQQTVTKWCPNERCGRVLQVNSDKVQVVTCACGQNVCFKCSGKTHWPAPCETANSYNKKMKELGFDDEVVQNNNLISSVNGMTCPYCKQFVEKNGGCPYMYCVCRKAFCWGCGKPWSQSRRSYNDHVECSKGSKNTHKGTRKRELNTFSTKQDKPGATEETTKSLFDVAVDHRIAQQKDKVKEMKVSAKKLSKGLQNYVSRAGKKGEAVLSDKFASNNKVTKETEHATDFLNSMVSLYSEINHIAEHTAVLLMDDTTLAGDIRRCFKHLIIRFQSFSTVIHETIVHGHDCPPKEVINRLKDVRFHALKGIKALLGRVQYKREQ